MISLIIYIFIFTHNIYYVVIRQIARRLHPITEKDIKFSFPLPVKSLPLLTIRKPGKKLRSTLL